MGADPNGTMVRFYLSIKFLVLKAPAIRVMKIVKIQGLAARKAYAVEKTLEEFRVSADFTTTSTILGSQEVGTVLRYSKSLDALTQRFTMFKTQLTHINKIVLNRGVGSEDTIKKIL